MAERWLDLANRWAMLARWEEAVGRRETLLPESESSRQH
jgi:hypothetical protein